MLMLTMNYSTHAAKLISLDPFFYPHNFALPNVNNALSLLPPVSI
jgi:hypothetical protein